MPRLCTICGHAARGAMDQALAAGEGFRQVAQRFAVSPDAVRRHKEAHLPRRLALAHAVVEEAEAEDLIEQVRALRRKAVDLLRQAEQAGDVRTALQGVREARACVELLLECEGRLDRRAQVAVLVSPEWQTVRAALLTALAIHPEARAAVATRLLALEAGPHAGT